MTCRVGCNVVRFPWTSSHEEISSLCPRDVVRSKCAQISHVLHLEKPSLAWIAQYFALQVVSHIPVAVKISLQLYRWW